MMTTLRTNRRTRRNATFHLECLDERIVLSAVGAEAHVAALIASGHVKAAGAFERHEARIERIEARHAAREARSVIVLAPSPTSVPGPVPMATGSTPATTAPTTSPSTAAPVSVPTATPVSMPTANPIVTTAPPSTSTSTPAASNTGTTGTLAPNVSSPLQSLYAQYESYLSTNSSSPFSATGLNMLVIKGNNVGINFETSDSADFNTILGQLQSDGLQIVSSSSTYGVIEGMLPIAQLPAVAQLPSASVTPMYQPMVN
jgi:hypothetical protein